jgi:hypothetical protein
VLPLAFWPTFLLLAFGAYQPREHSQGIALFVVLAIGAVVWAIWFAIVRALPWPPVPLDQLTDKERAARARRTQERALTRRARPYDLHPWLGVFCALFIGLNVLVAGYLCAKKRWREAFQAFVLPLAFWPTLLLAYGHYKPSPQVSPGIAFLASLPIATVVWASWFYLLCAAPWPPVSLAQLTEEERAAVTRRARPSILDLGPACFARY